MSNLKLHDVLRAQTVKRFHIVNTSRVQMLAEHQYGVAVLATEIANRLGWASDVVNAVTSAAIFHDAGEARTGDLPTPTKRRLREACGESFDATLAQFDPEFMKSMPKAIEVVLKCADFLESMWFLDEHQVGRHANAVMGDILTDAHEFFDRAGEAGRIAAQIWSELQNAVYDI